MATKKTPEGIAAKLAEVGREVAYVQKAAYNEGQNYYYASAEDVLKKVNEGLFTRGISVGMTAAILSDQLVERPKKSPMRHVIVRLRAVFSDSESGQTHISEGIGSGADVGDKAVMKAVTAAHKYLYALMFCISWGDDPEASEPTGEKSKPANKTSKKASTPAPFSDEEAMAALPDIRAAAELGDVEKAREMYRELAARFPENPSEILVQARADTIAAIKAALENNEEEGD